MEDVDLLHYGGENVVECGEPELAGQVLDDVEDLAGQVEADEDAVAGPDLPEAVWQSHVGLAALPPHAVVLPVGQRRRGQGGGSHQVTEETDAAEDHLPEHGLLASVGLHVQLRLKIGLAEFPQLRELSADPVSEILHEENVLRDAVRVCRRSEQGPDLACRAAVDTPRQGRYWPQSGGLVQLGVRVPASLHQLKCQPVAGLDTLPGGVALNVQLRQRA